MNEIRTPDGRPLRNGLCTCAVHCPNHCEPQHCPVGTPWCDCWCHEAVYREASEIVQATPKGGRR